MLWLNLLGYVLLVWGISMWECTLFGLSLLCYRWRIHQTYSADSSLCGLDTMPGLLPDGGCWWWILLLCLVSVLGMGLGYTITWEGDPHELFRSRRRKPSRVCVELLMVDTLLYLVSSLPRYWWWVFFLYLVSSLVCRDWWWILCCISSIHLLAWFRLMVGIFAVPRQ